MTAKRGDQARAARGKVARLDDRRAARDAQRLEEVADGILDQLIRRDVDAIKLPIEELLPLTGSLQRLRKAARIAGSRRGFKKTITTKMVDEDGREWLAVCDAGHDLKVVGEMDPRLRRALEALDTVWEDPSR